MQSNKSKTSHKRGFTLIELLVVVLIIGILAAVAVPQYKKAVVKSRVTEALTILKTLAHAEEVYLLANETGTTEIDKLDVGIPTNQISARQSRADVTQPNTYVYSCSVAGSCMADACNPDMPFLQYTTKYKEIAEGATDTRGFFYCVPYTWTSGCKAKTEIAEEICKSMNNGREKLDYKDGLTTYYRIN